MFKELSVKMFKFLTVGVLWVFILSIPINEKTLFDHASDILVKNPYVEYMDQQAVEYWSKIKETVTITYREISGSQGL